MDLSIVIVNYRSKEKLVDCLAALRANVSSDLKKEIIIVDNNSGDELDDLIEPEAGMKLIVSPKNLGMGGGNNLGLSQARGEFVLILNPDTLVKPGSLEALADHLRSNLETVLVGPKLLNPDGSLQFSCFRWPGFFTPIFRRTPLGAYFSAATKHFLMADFDHQSARTVDWLLGSCLMFRRETELGGQIFQPRFDERYFMYFEDTDLAREIWERGGRVVYLPTALVVHDHQRQSARYPWYLAIFLDGLARHHIASWFKYFIKWGIKQKNYEKN